MANGLATQDKRLLRLSTVLAKDELIPSRLTYTESLGSGFNINLSAFSEVNHDIQAKDLVGTAVSLALVDSKNQFRYLNGLVQQLKASPSTTKNNATDYQLTIVSWFQLLLSKRRNYRIFQDARIPDVIRTLFAEYGSIAKFDINNKNSYKPWRYLVQYDETDYDFVCRLMSLQGMTFFFDHQKDKHVLSIFDDSSLVTQLTPKSLISLHPNNYAEDSLMHWGRSSQFATGKHEIISYNYNNPSINLMINQQVDSPIANIPNVTNVSSYNYSGDYTAQDEGTSILTAQVNRESGKVHSWSGNGNVRTMAVGKNFSIKLADGTAHPDDGKLFTATTVSLAADDFVGELTSQVTAVEHGHLIYPQTESPKAPSLQTARVVGKQGQEIQTDKLGRVKVRFHWDRADSNGQHTCFLRVMQGFASAGFGAHFTPRVGDEVVVAFENGNPDRPFIIGSLYNSENNPPYAEHNGLRAGIRTRSSLKGGADNCNELYFHDEKGKEEVFFQAEKDHNSLIKNNQTTKIGNNKHQQVIKNETNKVGENLTINVGKTLLVEAGEQIKLQVGGSTITVTGDQISISSNTVTINGNAVNIN